ncbi:hypothetical protein ACR9KW_02210 [Helicobacter pylori]|uniref:hypothetical protein n=1 Tax=Helicobacter pylori TaxID=210 RepID=UPI00165B98C2|nr:hypothetical protein [Helicobacter pylori]
MAKIELLPTQIDCIDQGLQILKNHGWVYYAMQERTGKTLTALFSAFQFNPNAKLIIYTKKRAQTRKKIFLDIVLVMLKR